jgi:hypothetical protein
MNYAVELQENDYPNPKGTSMLLGIYPTEEAARFISKVVKNKFKLSTYPIVYKTNFPITSDKVENFTTKTNGK